MKKLFLIFCFCMAFYCLAKAQIQPQDNSTATKDETIQWLTTKIIQYANPHPFTNRDCGFDWIITTSGLSGTEYCNGNEGKSINRTESIDLNKFIDYSIDTNTDERACTGCTYLLYLKCTSGSVVFVYTHDPTNGNPGVHTAYDDKGLIYMTMDYAKKKDLFLHWNILRN